MFGLFDVPWNDVDLEQVREFFANAGEEGVTWEAKAEDERGQLRPDSIRKAACGLANQVGGLWGTQTRSGRPRRSVAGSSPARPWQQLAGKRRGRQSVC